MKKIWREFQLGDMTAAYIIDESKQVELQLYPTEMRQRIASDKGGCVDPLIQCQFDGDAACGGFAAGHTARNSRSTMLFRGISCEAEETPEKTVICTKLENGCGQTARHQLIYKKKETGVRIRTCMENQSPEPVVLNMLSSFSIGGLTPFDETAEFGQLYYHRIRSTWSAEGQVESGGIEELQLEPSWSGHGVRTERYGQTGSMPVRRFFPFGAIEDRKNKVIWAAALACGCTWQMEFFRRDENLCFSGGLGDFEFGHWQKRLLKDECFETPEAYVTVGTGFDHVCQRLAHMQDPSRLFNGEEKRLPAVFNEFCTTWGNPSQDKITQILEKIRDKDFDYFVIDAGWYADENGGWENNMGDWKVSPALFPDGMKETVRRIRNAGLRPGIWFELEVVGSQAKAQRYEEHLLHRNGRIVRSGSRCFWNMRDPWVTGYLSRKVIDLLVKYHFEYIKIDYNESIGIGCDGAESLGEGLYEHILAVQCFYERIHAAVPGIVIELCSSGGHRLEPSFLNHTDMASFSDAHEQPEIPAIAAAVHRVMRPEKSQIWSVIRKEDTPARICYSLVNTFLGVLCISGDVETLTPEQWRLLAKGMAFYRRLDNILKNGESVYFGTKQNSYRHLRGWQGILRVSEGEACLLLHSFEPGQQIRVPVREGYQVTQIYQHRFHAYQLQDGLFEVCLEEPFEAMAILLKRKVDVEEV